MIEIKEKQTLFSKWELENGTEFYFEEGMLVAILTYDGETKVFSPTTGKRIAKWSNEFVMAIFRYGIKGWSNSSNFGLTQKTSFLGSNEKLWQ